MVKRRTKRKVRRRRRKTRNQKGGDAKSACELNKVKDFWASMNKNFEEMNKSPCALQSSKPSLKKAATAVVAAQAFKKKEPEKLEMKINPEKLQINPEKTNISQPTSTLKTGLATMDFGDEPEVDNDPVKVNNDPVKVASPIKNPGVKCSAPELLTAEEKKACDDWKNRNPATGGKKRTKKRRGKAGTRTWRRRRSRLRRTRRSRRIRSRRTRRSIRRRPNRTLSKTRKGMNAPMPGGYRR